MRTEVPKDTYVSVTLASSMFLFRILRNPSGTGIRQSIRSNINIQMVIYLGGRPALESKEEDNG